MRFCPNSNPYVCHVRYAICAALVVSGLLAPRVLAQELAVDEVRGKAIASLKAVEEAYRHVRIKTKETHYASGEVSYITENEYLREGDLVRATIQIIESHVPERQVGTATAFGGSVDKFFRLASENDGDGFRVSKYQPRADEEDFNLATRDPALPLFASYCLRELRLVDYLEKPDVKFLGAKTTEIDGKQAIDLVTEWAFDDPDVGPGTIRYHLYFQPETYAFLGFMSYPPSTAPERKQLFHRRNTYVPGSNPPKLARIERYGTPLTEPDKKSLGLVYEIKSTEFGPIDPKEFTLAAFGLEEPANAPQRPATEPAALGVGGGAVAATVRGSGFAWIVILGAAALLALGVLFAVLSARRRRAA